MNEPVSEIRLRHEIESIRDYLVAARDVVNSGHMPVLSGLENRIAAVCESIQQAERDVQQSCLPELRELITHLNDCEKAMRASPIATATEEKPS